MPLYSLPGYGFSEYAGAEDERPPLYCALASADVPEPGVRVTRRTWRVWTESPDGDTVLFSGGRVAAMRYYRQHGGHVAGLHVGYYL